MTELSFAAAGRSEPGHGVSFAEALRVWLRVAALSFGGPAGQIAVMHRIIVDEKRWVGERRFLHALSYCMLLPGPEAQQLATYIGWLMHRWPGAVVAGGLFVVPGIICIMALSYVYAAFGNVPTIAALFFGLKAAVLAIVLYAVYRVGSRALKSRSMLVLAALALIGIFFLSVPFPLIVLAAGIIGFIGARAGSSAFQVGGESVLDEACVSGRGRKPIQIDFLARPVRPHRRRRRDNVGIGIESSQRIGLPAFRAVGVKQQIVKIPKYEVSVAFAGAAPVACFCVHLEEHIAIEQQCEQLDPGKILALPKLADFLRRR